MKIIIALAVVACVASLVAADTKPLPIETLFRSEVHDDFGQYSLSYQTSNGITVEEHGELKPTPDGKDHVLIRSGSYSYPAEDGTLIKTTYNADENGFVAQGDHLPKPVAPIV